MLILHPGGPVRTGGDLSSPVTMANPPDLFVVCKNCGSEVSPYITECPYCGQRLRKRAPKIERDEDGESRPKVRRKAPRPQLGRLLPNEIPGIKADELARPYVTLALVVLSAIGLLVVQVLDVSDVAVFGPLDGQPWRLVTGPLVYLNLWYELVALLTIGIFGWLLERRHGSLAVLVLWLACATGGAAVAVALEADPLVIGGNGGALGLLAAWALPVILARRGQDPDDDDADLLGVLVLGVLVAAMPIATLDADPVAGTAGGVIGLLCGLLLARLKPR